MPHIHIDSFIGKVVYLLLFNCNSILCTKGEKERLSSCNTIKGVNSILLPWRVKCENQLVRGLRARGEAEGKQTHELIYACHFSGLVRYFSDRKTEKKESDRSAKRTFRTWGLKNYISSRRLESQSPEFFFSLVSYDVLCQEFYYDIKNILTEYPSPTMIVNVLVNICVRVAIVILRVIYSSSQRMHS